MIVIIGGFPRSGTRSYADALNLIPNVDIRGEIHRAALPPLSNWLQLNDKAHKNLGMKEEYINHRWLTGLNAIVGTGRGGNSPFSIDQMLNNVVGFKCPVIEVRMKNLERVFKPLFNPFDDHKIPFFFCARRLDQVYLSRANMTKKKRGVTLDVDGFIKETIDQISALILMKYSKVFIPHVLQLEYFTSCSDRVDWLSNNIFSHLGLVRSDFKDLSDEMLLNNNSTNNVFGASRNSELQENLASRIKGNSDLVALCKEFEESYSFDLLSF